MIVITAAIMVMIISSCVLLTELLKLAVRGCGGRKTAWPWACNRDGRALWADRSEVLLIDSKIPLIEVGAAKTT